MTDPQPRMSNTYPIFDVRFLFKTMLYYRIYKILKPRTLKLSFEKWIHPPQCPESDSCNKLKLAQPENSKAIIIGGTGSVGMATATQLLCSKACQVALIDTDITKGKDAVVSLNCNFGKDKAMFIKADVTNKMEIQDSLRKARSELKQVDMIINTFGIWNETKWEDEVNVNLVGTINVNNIAKEIVTRPGGTVINIIGLPGVETFPLSPVLAATYFGVLAYSQAKGHERSANATGVRTVVLCCGITHSSLVKNIKVCCPQMANDLKKYIKEACWQKADAVGKATVELLKYAPSGGVWIVEGSRLFSLNWPDLGLCRKLENQFI
ncbi:hypothetical protein ABEB36_003994 [Hypothenemus hampei]|uniref:Uncharacterized protein n=1 Tax=Hypothenemus hampei TaxID=57062 RepID=A0ABD1F5L2_HYPHA